MKAADWQLDRLSDDAIAITDRLPPAHEYVLGWVSDKSVAIHHFPLVVWRDFDGCWWGGLPGNYLALKHLRWTVTHWRPIKPETPTAAPPKGAK
jgi:hypothetical protein